MLRTYSSPCSVGRAAKSFRRLNGEEGSSLVEFALVFVLVMTMMLGIVDFSRALYAYHFVSNAAREATRFAAVNGATCTADGSCAAPASTTDIQNFVKNVPSGIDSSKLTTTPSWPVQADGPVICSTAVGTVPATKNYPGCTVEVTVSYSFSFLFPFISTSSLNLSSTSEMVIAH
ncbi:MAG: TadE/TadG family type IV pilus assembly protein [Candidatus Acidiferrales bacterium]